MCTFPQLESGVIIIGAGVAGLAAARKLRAHCVKTTLIDALPRIGGRAVTVRLNGAPFDLGATWLHDADRNPLVALAEASDRLIDTDADRRERVTMAGRVVSPSEQAVYNAAWDRLDAVTAPALTGSDTTLAAAMAPMANDPWAPLIALWEGSIIAATDPDRLGLQDWHRNRLGGRNLVPDVGVGAFIARVLATETRLATPATRIAWDGQGVCVDTPAGRIHAGAAIVTVSTGVLAAGGIRFDPPLPPDVQTSIHALPMGLLSKIALPASSRLGLQAGTTLIDRDGRMSFIAWPREHDHIVGFVRADDGWALAAEPAALEAFARAELARTLGADALQAVGPAAIVTSWGTDTAFAGAYAYAGPGAADERATLAAAYPAERLVFAGEATRSDGLAGTVAGAYLSGIEAAKRLLSP